jgi:feruloyl-CoA synthase
MLCSSQAGLARGWPFLDETPPVLVDWLPWNHTFGGNHNFNLVLRNGGTLYIDGGKPVPGLVETTVKNLTEISPTLYFNVPRGFDLLIAHLEKNAALRASFFRRLDVVFYAAAALPQNLWERMEALAIAEQRPLAMLSAWGATETSPLATQVHFSIDRAGVVGLPIAGCELKLVPAAGKLEVRVRGPNVTPGYLANVDLTREAFDDEGFYKTGDAMKLADPMQPEAGLVFDGRVTEDFKLTTGTWVHVGALRTRFIAAADPVVQDAVITGHDRDEVGALVFLSANVIPRDARRKIAQAMRALAGPSSTSVRRALVMTEPPSLDAGEITDKGYINQRAVLERRAARVAELYADGPDIVRPDDADGAVTSST